jgi:D-aspartate ligase
MLPIKYTLNKLNNKTEKPTAVICGAADANGYGIIRSLAAEGVNVIALDTKRRALGLYSRYCKGMVCPNPKTTSEEIFIQFLLGLGSKFKRKAVLFPYREDLQLIILKNWDILAGYYLLPMSKLDKVEIIGDKEKFANALETMDVPYPKTYTPSNIHSIEEIANSITFPCIMKPTKSMEFGREFGVKVVKADTRDDLLGSYRRITGRGYQVVIQEIIPGDDSQLFTFFGYFDKNSKMLASFTMVKLRQCPPGFGVTALGKSFWEPRVVDLSRHILERIGYHGIVDAEFKWDERDKQFKIIEINARTGIQNRLAYRCGVNLPYIAYLDTIGETVKETQSSAREIRWVSEVDDARVSLRAILNHELTIRDWFRSLKGEKEYSIFALDDPCPFLVMMFNIIPDMFKAFIVRPIKQRKNHSHEKSKNL